MCERLFYKDGYLAEFDCQVTNVEIIQDLIYIQTDKTAFFPEGGGQCSDIGTLGGLQIIDVQEIEDKILHISKMGSDINLPKIGDTLHGKVDMVKRFSDMQQHSAEHILSGIAHRLYGFENTGFHLGANAVFMDLDHVLTKEQIQEMEQLANEVVWKNVKINCFFPTQEEAKNINYRSKMLIEQDLRIVEIEGVDLCACCAPHVAYTGEIGIIKIIANEKIRGGSRLSMLAGERAYQNSNEKLNENHKISNLLSAKENETSGAVECLMVENKKIKNEIYNLNKEILSFKISEVDCDDRIIVFDNSLSGNLLRDFATAIVPRAEEFVAVFAYVENCFKYVLASKNTDVKELGQALNSTFYGKGGGNSQVFQGSVSVEQEDLREFLDNFSVA